MSTAVFAKTSEKNDAVKKTGIVTSLSLDAKKNTVTVTLALGTVKTPDKQKEPSKENRKDPPKRPQVADMINLTGETVTFTVAADTAIVKDGPDSSEQLPPPPSAEQDKIHFQQKQIADVKLNDLLTVSFAADGTTVSSISSNGVEPPHAPQNTRPGDSPMAAEQGGAGGPSESKK